MKNEIETTIEKQDSIKLSKNSRGYTWEIKRYYDFSITTSKEVIDQIRKINEQMQNSFGGSNVE